MEEDKLRLLKLYNIQDLNFPQTFGTFLIFEKGFWQVSWQFILKLRKGLPLNRILDNRR